MPLRRVRRNRVVVLPEVVAPSNGGGAGREVSNGGKTGGAGTAWFVRAIRVEDVITGGYAAEERDDGDVVVAFDPDDAVGRSFQDDDDDIASGRVGLGLEVGAPREVAEDQLDERREAEPVLRPPSHDDTQQ